jgi:tetratricopeptide (TPR) repeat protein
VGELVGVLHRFSLVKRADQQFGVHRLVQDVIRLSLTEAERRRLLGSCLSLLAHQAASDATAEDDPLLLAHALALIPHAAGLPTQATAVEELLVRMGQAVGRLVQRGGTSQSVAQARMIASAVCGEDNPAVARVLVILGRVLLNQGSRVAGRACFEQALTIAEPIYGCRHRDVVIIYNELATVLRQQGDHRGAANYLKKAVQAQSQVPSGRTP